MASQNYKLKVEGIKIFTRKFGLITSKNFNDEIAEYLLKSGGYNHIIEIQHSVDITDITEVATDSDVDKTEIKLTTKKRKKHGTKKSDSKTD